MKAVLSSVVLAALLGFVNAKVELTNTDYDDIEAGSIFKITWQDAEGPVTLTLKNGPEKNLQTVQTITTTGSDGEFLWTVDQSLPAGQYALEINDGSDVNYSEQFPIASTAEPTSSSETTTATVTRTTTVTSETSSSETTSSETSTSETTSAETTTTKSSSSSAETTVTSTNSVTRTTSSTPSATESDAAETSVPNTNDARSMMAPVVPGLLALLGAAIL